MTEQKRRTLAEIIVAALTDQPAETPVCLVHENMIDVRSVKAGTKLTMGLPSHVFSADDAMWFTGEMGRPKERRPKYVGYLVFVPMNIARIDEIEAELKRDD